MTTDLGHVREHRFPPVGPPRAVQVRNAAGTVTVDAGAPGLVVRLTALDRAAREVLDLVEVTVTGDSLRVVVPTLRPDRTPTMAVAVRTPDGATVTVETASADVALRASLGAVVVATASGAVTVEQAARLEVRTASGAVHVATVAGPVTIGTASGAIRVLRAGGPLDLRSTAGGVTVGAAAGDVRVSTASGAVEVDRVASGTVQVSTVSGDAAVGIAHGVPVRLDARTVSGRLGTGLDDEAAAGAGSGEPGALAVVLQSVSGDLHVSRAAAGG